MYRNRATQTRAHKRPNARSPIDNRDRDGQWGIGEDKRAHTNAPPPPPPARAHTQMLVRGMLVRGMLCVRAVRGQTRAAMAVRVVRGML